MDTLDSVRRQGRERLFPSITNPNWPVLRRRREIFRRWISRLNGRDLQVLDIGGRIQPYRELFADRIDRYVAIDLRLTPLVNIVARGEQIPLASGGFDVVMCTQVLQYVPEPGRMIAEIHRLLKPGGCFLLSAPSAYLRDAEEDAWRFLPAALRHLLSSFSELEIVPEGGSIIGFFRTINVCLNFFARYSVLRAGFRWTVCPVLNVCGEFLDRIARSNNDQFTTNYSVWARK